MHLLSCNRALIPVAAPGYQKYKRNLTLTPPDTRSTKFALANMAGTLAGFAAVNKRFTLCPVCGGLMEDGTCEVCEIRCKMKQGTIS